MIVEEKIEDALKKGSKVLDFSMNELTTLPDSIGNLQNIEWLSLRHNKLTTLPDSIGNLQNLKWLFLRDNKLTTLPDSIGNLQNLEGLDLITNELTTLPDSMGKLRNLKTLYVSGNKLTALPDSIGMLQNIEDLWTSANRLTTLPDSIGKLQNLKTLYVRENELTTLPKSIVNLNSLERLNLSFNQLISLPHNINKLISLMHLNLEENKITHAPKQLFDLDIELIKGTYSGVDGLILNRNPLESPPLEITEQGLDAVRDYLKQLEGDTVQLFEAKLLIVGQGGVGKTFLVNRLMHGETPMTETTLGIDIHTWPLKTSKSDEFRANFWDFGGQAIYHATHQFFLTKRSLYLFVWEARSDDDISSFDYWLNTIQVLSGDSPVLVIQNKIEERKKAIDQRYWMKLFNNIVEYHDVSAIEGIGIDALKGAIIREINQLPHIGDELPKKWVDIRSELEAMEENYIPYTHYQDICRAYDMEAIQIDRLSQYYHDLGVFLRFADNSILRATVFLNPEWATNAVYEVLDDKTVQAKYGRFCFDDLGDIWKDTSRYPTAMHGNLIELMKSFELCFELPQKNEYIIPELLKPEEPKIVWDYTDNLRFKYQYEFMPAGVITRFIVSVHDLIEQDLYWQNGLVIRFEDATALVKKTRNRVIEIWIRGGDKRPVLSIVRHEFNRINGSFSNLTVDQMVMCICSECSDSQSPHFFTYQKLLGFRARGKQTMECMESGENVPISQLLGVIETLRQTESTSAQINHIYGDTYMVQGNASFNRIEVEQTIAKVRYVIEETTEIDDGARRKFLDHVDNIFKEFTKEGAKAGAVKGYEALKEYMVQEGIPKALSRALKVASGGWLG